MKYLLAIALALAPSFAWAADAIVYPDSPGLTLYVRVRTSATASVAVALTEGTSAGVGYYYVTEAALVSAGLSSAGTYPFKIFSGTASTSANDPLMGMGILPWTGSAYQDVATSILNTTITDTGAGKVGRFFSWLNTSLTSNGVFGAPALVNTPAVDAEAIAQEVIEGAADAGALVITDVDQDPVPTGRTFILVQTPALGLRGEVTKSIASAALPKTFAADFRNDLPVNGRIITVNAPELVSGSGLTFGAVGRDHSQAKFIVSDAPVGTYQIQISGTYYGGQPFEGTVTLKVVE